MSTTPDAVYLDHAATTPLAAEVAEAMASWITAGAVGNASSLHAAGRRARAAVEDARDTPPTANRKTRATPATRPRHAGDSALPPMRWARTRPPA